jgi:hypothetical protein
MGSRAISVNAWDSKGGTILSDEKPIVIEESVA